MHNGNPVEQGVSKSMCPEEGLLTKGEIKGSILRESLIPTDRGEETPMATATIGIGLKIEADHGFKRTAKIR